VLAATLPLTASAQVPATAFRAFFIAGKSFPGGSLVRVSGERGATQPQAWIFLYLDPSARGGVREVVVVGGSVESVRTPLRGYTEISGYDPLSPDRLKVDSDRAFAIANAEAVKARLPFHWAGYSLRAGTGGSPVWTLRLTDRMGIPVARLEICAESGAVLGSLLREPSPGEAVVKPSEPVGGLIGDALDLGARVGRTVSDTTLGIVGAGQEYLTGERTIGVREGE